MYPMYFMFFNLSLTDDIRDLLFQTAYLLLKTGQGKRKARSGSCEGVVTNLGSVALYGMGGVQFEGRLDTNRGELKVTYIVRPQDLQRMEQDDVGFGAWLTLLDLFDPPADLEERIRPNPIGEVSRAHHAN
ncbi:MAG: hypothetical protein Q8Q48_03400 [Candidatus Staskawiczbacteria bacterium]|nr:hypothetical protein [Candidatus Staskawiczbacteria bacterium]